MAKQAGPDPCLAVLHLPLPSQGKSSRPWLHVGVTGEDPKSTDAQTEPWTD